jgi:hypothetical protein
MPALARVAGEVGRAIAPHLGQEDFVTAALAQITATGELTVVNCGQHRRCCATAATPVVSCFPDHARWCGAAAPTPAPALGARPI